MQPASCGAGVPSEERGADVSRPEPPQGHITQGGRRPGVTSPGTPPGKAAWTKPGEPSGPVRRRGRAIPRLQRAPPGTPNGCFAEPAPGHKLRRAT